MALMFRYGKWMCVKKMTQGRVPSNQNDALESITNPAFFQKPEKAFDCDVNNRVWSVFASSAVNHVRNSYHRGLHDLSVRDAPSCYLQALLMLVPMELQESLPPEQLRPACLPM